MAISYASFLIEAPNYKQSQLWFAKAKSVFFTSEREFQSIRLFNLPMFFDWDYLGKKNAVEVLLQSIVQYKICDFHLPFLI